jgi:hypothetical protein
MTETGPTGLFAVLHASNVLESLLEARLSEGRFVAGEARSAPSVDRPPGSRSRWAAGRTACLRQVERDSAGRSTERPTAWSTGRRIRTIGGRVSRCLTPAGRNGLFEGDEIGEQTEQELFREC